MNKNNNRLIIILVCVIVALLLIFCGLIAYANFHKSSDEENSDNIEQLNGEEELALRSQNAQAKIAEALSKLTLTQDFRKSLTHGPKTAVNQKWIVLHDTEGDGLAENVVSGWDGNGKGVAAQFIVNKDGSIVQCVAIDEIAHHAGYGDTGHNAQFGVIEDGRDDMVGTVPIGS